jgi:7-cyano-7-deazaguanine synthase in queuosine biosynthesis
MNALNSSFGFTVINGGPHSLSLREGRHFRMYPTGRNSRFGELLSHRQIDLLRISMAIHAADGWARRLCSTDGHRRPVLDVEVLDAAFWKQPNTYALLKKCVDFLSGDDDWSFRFIASANNCHERIKDLFRGHEQSALVALYSGGLDSAAGLAARLADEPGRMVIPVTVRHQMQKGKLVRDHFELLINEGLAKKADLRPFQAGAFIRNKRIKHDFQTQLREVTHRCRPMLFMAVAGMVAYSVASPEVEIFESGVGSVNLPLVSGPADYRTTRSTHPHYLRLISELISHVNEAAVRFVLPFADLTKAEMVKRVRDLGLEELARMSVSCILHPLQRPNRRQCGYCTACVYRRQAMIAGGIDEGPDAYEVDLFSPFCDVSEKHLRGIRAFHQQACRLAELDGRYVPEFFRRHLYATHAVSPNEDLASYVEVYRRYGQEWADLIADARRRGLAWVAPVRSSACAQGAVP